MTEPKKAAPRKAAPRKQPSAAAEPRKKSAPRKKKSAAKSQVKAIQSKDGTWRWEWRSPNGAQHLHKGFPTEEAALEAGRKLEDKHRKLTVIDPSDPD